MAPTIDPLSHKNRELSPHKLTGVLCNSALMKAAHPVLTPPFQHPVLRLQPDGTFAPVDQGPDVGLLFRPVVSQISRWDFLKGFRPLLEGFRVLKRRADDESIPPRHRRRLESSASCWPDPIRRRSRTTRAPEKCCATSRTPSARSSRASRPTSRSSPCLSSP